MHLFGQSVHTLLWPLHCTTGRVMATPTMPSSLLLSHNPHDTLTSHTTPSPLTRDDTILTGHTHPPTRTPPCHPTLFHHTRPHHHPLCMRAALPLLTTTSASAVQAVMAQPMRTLASLRPSHRLPSGTPRVSSCTLTAWDLASHSHTSFAQQCYTASRQHTFTSTCALQLIRSHETIMWSSPPNLNVHPLTHTPTGPTPSCTPKPTHYHAPTRTTHTLAITHTPSLLLNTDTHAPTTHRNPYRLHSPPRTHHSSQPLSTTFTSPYAGHLTAEQLGWIATLPPAAAARAVSVLRPVIVAVAAAGNASSVSRARAML
jgi:hypothetical protein